MILDKYIFYGFKFDLPLFFIIIKPELYALLSESIDSKLFNVFNQHIIWVDSEQLANCQSFRGQVLASYLPVHENMFYCLL